MYLQTGFRIAKIGVLIATARYASIKRTFIVFMVISRYTHFAEIALVSSRTSTSVIREIKLNGNTSVSRFI